MKLLRLALIVAALAASACAPKAINGRSTSLLSRPSIQALQRLEVVKVIDVIRDTAIDAEAIHVLPTTTTRKIVQAHKSSIDVIRQAQQGWNVIVITTLEELKKNLTDDEVTLVGAYIDAAIATIKAVIV